MSREKTLDNKVKDFLKARGSWNLKYWAGGGFTKAGVPDILACVDGYFFGIDGAGYSFYEEHWIPLYKARGLQWHKENEEE